MCSCSACCLSVLDLPVARPWANGLAWPGTTTLPAPGAWPAAPRDNDGLPHRIEQCAHVPGWVLNHAHLHAAADTSDTTADTSDTTAALAPLLSTCLTVAKELPLLEDGRRGAALSRCLPRFSCTPT